MAKASRSDLSNGDNLTGQMLIAMPGMLDDMFNGTAVLMCTHSAEGAMGLIINRVAEGVGFEELVQNLDLLDEDDDGDHAQTSEALGGTFDPQPCPMHIGGPVEPNRGFVLHTPDYFVRDNTVEIIPGVCMTATVDILRVLATRKGPREAVLMLGYSAWDAGQLEAEIQRNGWLHTPATDTLVFHTGVEQRYGAAMAHLGIDPSFLVATSGRA